MQPGALHPDHLRERQKLRNGIRSQSVNATGERLGEFHRSCGSSRHARRGGGFRELQHARRQSSVGWRAGLDGHGFEGCGRLDPKVEARIPGIRVYAFGHLGDGNAHFNLSQPVGADTDAFLARWGEINRAVHDITMAMGGSFSAEHGIGRLKRDDLKRYKSPVEIALMQRLKQALDPQGIMNPGKVV